MIHMIQKATLFIICIMNYTHIKFIYQCELNIKYKIFNSETLKQKRHTVQGQRIGVLIPRQLLIHCLFLYSSFLWFEIFHPGGRFVRTQEVNKTYKIQEVSN